MKNHYSEIRLHQITYYPLLSSNTQYSQLLSTQFIYAATRLQSFANCSIQKYLLPLANTDQKPDCKAFANCLVPKYLRILVNADRKPDCKKIIFNHHILAVCNVANLVSIRSHPP
jgi:hypothetical protein